MKVIVFGGSGFIGSNVADVLTEMGHKVVIYDIKKSVYLQPNQEMIIGDILDQERVESSVKGCDIVYHFAGIADIDEAKKKPIDSVKYNILGTAIVLEACRKAGVKRFIFASSMYVYSKSGAFYRSTKQASELLTENYQEIYGIPYTILRFGSLYGPRCGNNNYIHRIIIQALKEGKIVRYGDGEEIREYIHVHDAAKGSVEVLADEFVNQRVIISGNQQMKIKDVLIMIKEMLNNKIKLEFKPAATNVHYEITPYAFELKLAKRIVPKSYYDLGQGILKSIENIYEELNPEGKGKRP